MSITGLPGQGPVRVGIPIDDLCAGLLLAEGILMALIEREQSGEGQWVESSLLAAQIAMLDFQAARWLIAGEVPEQAGNDHPTSIPTGVFRTRCMEACRTAIRVLTAWRFGRSGPTLSSWIRAPRSTSSATSLRE